MGSGTCEDPVENLCVHGTPAYRSVCTESGCATPTPGPHDCCQTDEPSCAGPPTDGDCGAATPVYRAACLGDACVPFTPTPTVTPTATVCP